MTREEFMLRLGVDTTAVGKGLRGIRVDMNSFFGGIAKDWKASTVVVTKEIKTQADNYVDFWKQALNERDANEAAAAKKRIEMETQASIEAATRSNRARRLLRDRASSRAERESAEQSRINEEVARGHRPESWGSGGKGSGVGAAAGAGAAIMLGSVIRDSFASLASGQNPITVMMQQGPQVWQAFQMYGKGFLESLSKMGRLLGSIGAVVGATVGLGKFINWQVNSYYDSDVKKMRYRHNEEYAAIYRKRREDAEREREEEKKKQEELEDNAQKSADLQRSVNAAVDANRIKNAKTDTERFQMSLKTLRAQRDIAAATYEQNKWSENSLHDQEAANKAAKSRLEFENAKQAVLDKEKEFGEYQKRTAKERLEIEKQIESAKKRQQTAVNDRVVAIGERSRFTLGEMADRGSRPAQIIENIERQAKEARWFGNFSGADAMTNRALELRKGLSNYLVESDANPLKSMDENIKAQLEAVNELVDKAKGEGLNINATKVQ